MEVKYLSYSGALVNTAERCSELDLQHAMNKHWVEFVDEYGCLIESPSDILHAVFIKMTDHRAVTAIKNYALYKDEFSEYEDIEYGNWVFCDECKIEYVSSFAKDWYELDEFKERLELLYFHFR
jgi:hypothetical protein